MKCLSRVARIGTRVSFEALCANIDFCGEANFGMRNWSTPVNYKPNIEPLLKFLVNVFITNRWVCSLKSRMLLKYLFFKSRVSGMQIVNHWGWFFLFLESIENWFCFILHLSKSQNQKCLTFILLLRTYSPINDQINVMTMTNYRM